MFGPFWGGSWGNPWVNQWNRGWGAFPPFRGFGPRFMPPFRRFWW